jgi:hypothetical protein
MAFPALLTLRVYRPASVCVASFALPRGHHKEVRLAVGGNESSLDPNCSYRNKLIKIK